MEAGRGGSSGHLILVETRQNGFEVANQNGRNKRWRQARVSRQGTKHVWPDSDRPRDVLGNTAAVVQKSTQWPCLGEQKVLKMNDEVRAEIGVPEASRDIPDLAGKSSEVKLRCPVVEQKNNGSLARLRVESLEVRLSV